MIRSERNLLQLAFLGSLAAGLLVSCSWFGPQQSSAPKGSHSPASPSSPVGDSTQPDQASPSQQPKPSTSTQPISKTQTKQPPTESTAAAEKDLISKVQKEVNEKGSIAKQDAGQTYVGNILQSQQATQLVTGRFTANLQELNLNLPAETDEYRLQILTANDHKAIVVAIAKQPGIFSYTGAVYARKAKLPVVTICKSNEPSRKPPATPKLVQSGIVCPSGSTAVD
ncbi:MAG: hypothetical protein HC934_06330 [Acaryochloridaceae cyanobacterium SU_2_1]|nr:hypothetical protein [Acaryochloridaceae cyanobacterium SU_2_1]NJM95111.1 hypothetical protein [Acaryochloridaceae cyanobacterium CSU_5_19]